MSSTEAMLAGRPWELADMPDQTDRTIVVTGPTLGGLGHHTALELARRGARVVLAGRNETKLEQTKDAIRSDVGDARLATLTMDLAELDSVRHAAAAAARFGAIDVLVNNAGVMAPPFRRTGDALEFQMATNHFGPFLLTGLLFPQLVQSNHGRVVTVSSQFHRAARRAPLGDPREHRGRYRRWQAYAETKLANLLFVGELQRRCRAEGVPLKALAAHPGFAGTHLAANGQYGRSSGGVASVLDGGIKAVSQSAARGALSTLMAATAELPGDTYCGPTGAGQMAGPPRVVGRSRLARDEDAARRLWELSEETTGISYP